MTAPARGFPRFTPAEALAWRTWADLGDGARRGLHLAERVASREITLAHAQAEAVAKRLRRT